MEAQTWFSQYHVEKGSDSRHRGQGDRLPDGLAVECEAKTGTSGVSMLNHYGEDGDIQQSQWKVKQTEAQGGRIKNQQFFSGQVKAELSRNL